MVDRIELIIKTTILSEMISASYAAKMPKSFIKNIRLTKLEDGKYEIRNNWTGPKGEPLAVFFEYGTVDHFIPGNPVLVFESKGPQSGSAKAIYSKSSSNVKGNMIFSTGHYVKGLVAHEPMFNGFKKGSKRMAREIENGK